MKQVLEFTFDKRIIRMLQHHRDIRLIYRFHLIFPHSFKLNNLSKFNEAKLPYITPGVLPHKEGMHFASNTPELLFLIYMYSITTATA